MEHFEAPRDEDLAALVRQARRWSDPAPDPDRGWSFLEALADQVHALLFAHPRADRSVPPRTRSRGRLVEPLVTGFHVYGGPDGQDAGRTPMFDGLANESVEAGRESPGEHRPGGAETGPRTRLPKGAGHVLPGTGS
jgi:hypothetical protein